MSAIANLVLFLLKKKNLNSGLCFIVQFLQWIISIPLWDYTLILTLTEWIVKCWWYGCFNESVRRKFSECSKLQGNFWAFKTPKTTSMWYFSCSLTISKWNVFPFKWLPSTPCSRERERSRRSRSPDKDRRRHHWGQPCAPFKILVLDFITRES